MKWCAGTLPPSPAPLWSATRPRSASCAMSTRRAIRTSSGWRACMACSTRRSTTRPAQVPTFSPRSPRPSPPRWSRSRLLRHVEVTFDEVEVDERLGIGVARHLAGRLPEGDLLVDVADIQAAFGIDVGQAARHQCRRLLQRVAQDPDHLVVIRSGHQLAVLALAEGFMVGRRATPVARNELLDHR